MFDEKTETVPVEANNRVVESLIQQTFLLMTGGDGVVTVNIKGTFGEVSGEIGERNGMRWVNVTARPPLTDESPTG